MSVTTHLHIMQFIASLLLFSPLIKHLFNCAAQCAQRAEGRIAAERLKCSQRCGHFIGEMFAAAKPNVRIFRLS